MNINTNISLSSATDIYTKVRPHADDFQFDQIIGSFIVNNEFKKGFTQYVAHKNNSKSYVWEALSAVGQEFGEVLVQNVKGYIDNISNVDTCKIKALRSMMQMVDMDYDLLRNTETYPIEIVKLMDVLSINRKYLLNNNYIKQDFLDYLNADGIISSYNNEQMYTYDDDQFNSYIGGIFYNFIYGLLNHSIKTSDGEKKIKDTVSNMYGKNKILESEQTSYITIEKKKSRYGIESSFDYVKIVDDIDQGNDSLDNYQGYKREILEDVISLRAESYGEYKKYYKETRYFYYKQKKIVEIAEFIDNTYTDLSSIMDVILYDYDKNYMEMQTQTQSDYVLTESNGEMEINTDKIEIVSTILTQMVIYIRKIRERLKIHVRQVYMKGTANLVKYITGQFLIDYFDQMKNNVDNDTTFLSDEEKAKFYELYNNVQKIGYEQGFDQSIKIQEYIDETEYMNLKTETTDYAFNKNYTNSRFFDEYFDDSDGNYDVKDPKNFTTEEINDFYLNKLALKNEFKTSLSINTDEQIQQKFYNFLEVLFDVGANTSYYDSTLSIFGSKLEDGTYSTLRYYDFEEINNIINELSGLKVYTDNYEFDISSTIEDQRTHFLERYELKLSGEYLSGVYEMYDKYHPIVDDLSTQRDDKKKELEDYLSGEYFYYFEKSDNEYCLDEDGNYNLDYFLGNDQYPVESYLYDRYTDAYNWITAKDHCRNWPVLCASTKLKEEYNLLKQEIEQNITEPLATNYGYAIPTTEDLGVILDDAADFVTGKIQQRLTFLTNALENLRTQSQELKKQHDDIANTVDQILAQNPGLEQGFAMSYAGKTHTDDGWVKLGEYEKSKEGGTASAGRGDNKVYESAFYDKFSGEYFIHNPTVDEDGNIVYIGLFDQNEFSISLDGALEDRVGELIGVFDNVYYGTHGSYNSGTNEALKSAQTNLNVIETSIDSIVEQIKSLYQVDASVLDEIVSSNAPSISIIERITKLIAYLGSEITEIDFEKDLIMKTYRGYEDLIRQAIIEYDPLETKYKSLFNVFSNFLSEFQEDNPSYYTFSATNLEKIYSYTIKEDNKKLEIIKEWFASFEESYNEILEQFQNFIQDLHNDEVYFIDSSEKKYIYEFSSQLIEECIYDLEDALNEDVTIRTVIGNRKIYEKLYYCETKLFSRTIELYYQYLKSNLGNYDEVTGRTIFEKDLMALNDRTWDDLNEELRDYLDYQNDSNYIQSRKIFKAYSGIVRVYDAIEGKDINIAEDPYYNHKNITHPSYQIHPFLWNFVEQNSSDVLTQAMNQYITNLDLVDLETPYVEVKIDEYIGEFGNIIDKWNKEYEDYSGWTTRYESSTHICNFSNLSSEVVDYDGAFYPPALEEYLNGKTTISALDKYYSHLKYYEDTDQVTKTNNNLSNNYYAIKNITSLHVLSNVYDMFKYQMDTYGNIYILYKRYGTDNPSMDDKLNAIGELWIRLVDNPIAFPAKDILESDSYAPFFGNVSSNEFKIKDINITGDKTRILIAYYKDNDYGVEQCINLFLNYVVEDSGIGHLKITSYDIEDELKEADVPVPDDSLSNYTYVGSYNRQKSVDRTDAIFIERDEDGNIPDKPTVQIYQYETAKVTRKKVEVQLTDLTGLYRLSEEIAPPINYWCDYDNNNYLDLLFLVPNEDISATVYKNRNVNFQTNTDGSRIDNVSQEEMTSHDIFNQNMIVERINLEKYTVTTKQFNINADLGYIPAYPGNTENKKLDLSKELGDNYQSIELLGKSQNIDDLINNINTEVNQYLTKEDILSNYLYGRVFEDFNISNDTTLNIYTNSPMFRNMKNTSECGYYSTGSSPGYYTWSIDFSQYRYNQLSLLKVIIYNVNSSGRNPYVVEDLSAFMEIERKEDPGIKTDISTNYISETDFDESEYEFSYNDNIIKIHGTCNGTNEINNFFTNRIDNIRDIKINSFLNTSNPSFKIKLYEENLDIDSYIDKDILRVAIINTHDYSQFEAYHFLDVNGFIKESTKGPYYTNDKGKKIYLKDLHLSSYQDKEDIYAFATSKRLQFKYSSEDVFDLDDLNYYFPCLNIKIPYTTGQYYNDNFFKQNAFVTESSTVELYSQETEYTIVSQEANIVSSMNGIEFTSNQNYDELRVFEDYLSTYTGKDGKIYSIQGRYSEYDPQMYQYAHFYSDILGTTVDDGGGIAIPDSEMSNVIIDNTNHDDKFSEWLYKHGLKALKGETTLDDNYTQIYFYFQKLSADEKAKLIEGIKRFMNLYISYKKSSSGIDLYVNYQNFINTPYIKIEDDKIKQEKIDGTYAIIRQDESNIVSIVIQMIMYNGNKIYSIKNISLATFKITNISDDKPKFVITRIKDIDDSNFKNYNANQAYIVAEKKTYILRDNDPGFNYKVQLNSNYDINGMVSCYMVYDTLTLSSDTSGNGIKKISDGVYNLEFSQYDRTKNFLFHVNDTNNVRVARALGKPRTVAVYNIYSENNQEISAKNGYVKIINQNHTNIKGGEITPDVVIYTNNYDTWNYSVKPTVSNVKNIFDETLTENIDYTVSYEYYSGSITISEDAETYDIQKQADKNIHVKVTGMGQYAGTLDFYAEVYYIKTSYNLYLGYTSSDKIITSDDDSLISVLI